MSNPTTPLGTAHPYTADGTECIGYLALPEGDAPCPGVLVSPAFAGLSPTEKAVCDRLAGMGYAALGVDYYGGGALARDREEAAGMMALVNADRPMFARRMQGALDAIRAVPRVTGQKIGAMGFCLGGKSVLDLARAGAEFDAGASLHGVYDPPPTQTQAMHPAMLILHGWDDSLCPPDMTVDLAQELNTHCADWQMLAFGRTGHAYTNPAAAPGNGFGYSASANRRSWDALTLFFAEHLRGETS